MGAAGLMRQVTEEQAFSALVRRHQADLWRYLRFLGCDGAQAEDLVQETFLAVWRKPFQQRGDRSTAAYLRTVARNLFLMAVRRKRARPAFRRLEEADAAWDQHAGNGSQPYREALQGCLRRLSERARRVLDLFYRDRQSRGQIAAELGMKPDGVKTMMRRTRDALRTCIERDLEG